MILMLEKYGMWVCTLVSGFTFFPPLINIRIMPYVNNTYYGLLLWRRGFIPDYIFEGWVTFVVPYKN